jgi:hypothetical protein
MSYDLDLYLEPAVAQNRILRYFATRKHYKIEEKSAIYQNPDTGVYFFIRLQCRRNLLFQKNVVSAAFEINYSRPSFFGTEAEIELSNFVAQFQPRLHDPQMHGMGEGPYSGEGFLKGWNFGNALGVRVGLSKDFDAPTMPTNKLRTIWAWNYHLSECRRQNPDCFVPTIRFFRIHRHAGAAVAWGDGMPFLLPKVDYVLVGRDVAGEVRFGLAPWSEVVEVITRAGFDTTNDSVKLSYATTPRLISNWVADIPLIENSALDQLGAYQILDDELIAAARESIERDKDDPSIMTIRRDT